MPALMSTIAQARTPFLLLPLAVALAAGQAQAAGFTINGTSSTAQTLSSGTGAITAGSTLNVSGGSVAITVTGNNATIDNQGTLLQSGTGSNAGRAIRDNTGVTNLVVTNGSASNASALMRTADGDVIQMNKAKSSATLDNYGTMLSLNASGGGSQAVDFNAMTGANVVNNYATGLLKALQADAVRPGAGGVVNNAGTILSATTTGSSSDGIDGQANSGIVVNNSGLVEGARHGITGGAVDANTAYTMSVTNALGGRIQGDNGSGINLDGFNGKQLVTVTNHGTITGSGLTGDGDGVDVDGLVNLVNTGVIQSLNSVDASGATAFSEGITVGGGSIANSGTIAGYVAPGNVNAKGVGITLTGNDILDAKGNETGQRDGLYGNAAIRNQAGGLISGSNSSAIALRGNPSAFSASIANDAGATLRGGGSTDAAIQAGADPLTVDNAGTIDGSSSGRAFAGGGGNVAFNITGGSAVVLGDIDGGAGSANKMTIAPGAGNSFAYAASIANFDSVEVASGTVTLSGSNAYTGTTRIDSDASLVLDGAGRLAAGSKLDLEGGMLKLVDVHGADGQEFAVMSLGKDSAIDLGDSSLTVDALGSVVAGTTLSVTDYLASVSPTYALRFLGNLTGNAAFLALMGDTTIDGVAAEYRFDGVYTDVTAVPEPANVALLLAGLGLLGATARRRRQSPDA